MIYDGAAAAAAVVAFDENVDDVAVVLQLVVSDDYSDVYRAVKIVDIHDVTIAETKDDSSFLKLLNVFLWCMKIQDVFYVYVRMSVCMCIVRVHEF